MTASSSPASQASSAQLANLWWISGTSLLFPVLLVMGAAYVAFVVMQNQLTTMAEERKAFITGVQTQVTALATERTDALAKIMTGKLEEAKLLLEAQKQAATQLAQEFENRQKLITAERESVAKLQAGLLDAQLQHIKDAGAGAKAREAAEAELYKTLLDRSKPPSQTATASAPADPSCAGINDRLLAMKIQLALRERGLYSGPIDGDIGSGSRASLTAFQRSQGWEERGLRDKDTLAKLKIGCGPSA
jgi:septal ring factor EnvC (AmiA/AmiB activator)